MNKYLFIILLALCSGQVFSQCGDQAQLDSLPVGIPAYFSPNGDGYNDSWDFARANCYPFIQVTVYNKWGQMVYERIERYEDKPWDGSSVSSNIILPTATYYYIVKKDYRDNARGITTGAVTIIK